MKFRGLNKLNRVGLKRYPLALATLTLLILSSCGISSRYVGPPYTTVEKIIKVKNGMSIEQVNDALGINPYDLYIIEEDGGSILIYNYVRKNRRIVSQMEELNVTKYKTEGLTKGEDWYDVDNPQKIYVFFKDGKAVSILSDRGRMDAAALMITENKISLISEDELTSMPATTVVNADGTVSRVIDLNQERNQSEDIKTFQSEEQPKQSKGAGWAWTLVGVLAIVLAIGAASY